MSGNPFDGPGHCIEYGDFDDLKSGLCEICIEEQAIEDFAKEVEDEDDA